ncbi:cupin domain-containing protein [Solirubrobacter sp. CPCC 204708]|uniref:Cupin domain-containing protein n=1 Tax=Solirubrobacter deserti TaxID=2282478 RepID=A0ABT4RCX4_9ACTN|nr:cupin domain-containing protein [Solirubrobacter deserti]MBE2317850.1 cupin domain-containing protein [Solirubrobacter deserti]MDA0136373.1 cupin domain-containing protein [Solirubrobacter deserti]
MELETWAAPPGETIPNHPRYEVLLYRGVDVSDVQALFAEHGWGGSWVNGVFDYHHFHSTSHEVLAVIAGNARLELGGPQGDTFVVAAGDVIVLPAGTGHRRAEASADFRVVGAYPEGQEDYDLLREADEAAIARIDAVALPRADPVGGEGVGRWS